MSISMAIQQENENLPLITPPNPSPNKSQPDVVSQSSSSHHHNREVSGQKDQPPASPMPVPAPSKNSPSPSIEAIRVTASRIASQPLPCSDPDVWGVLTGICDNSRKRLQGMNMLLSADEHVIGRTMTDASFRIDSAAVSQRHCQILRRRVAMEDVEDSSCIYECILKDTSTNGTYVNWDRIKKDSSMAEARLHHGDIISFVGPPQHDQAFAFVFREVMKFSPSTDGGTLKRKSEDFCVEGKRLKGIGIGAPGGCVNLDEFRTLQRSNMDLRKQLEENVLTISSMQKENHAVVERHENEMKEVRESISRSYVDQLKELNELLELRRKELEEASKISTEQKHAIEDLNERLASSLQSCAEANEIVKSQKASLAELKTQLDEERDQRREEREKAAADLKSAVHKVQLEGQEDLKRLSDTSFRIEREQQEVINKLQESERESSSLLESLRSKLEETRQKLVISDNKVRQLETNVLEEQRASASRKRRVEELELEVQKTRMELESEKAAREEAWAKVSALELQINVAMRDLDFERRRLKGARERIMLRETQLRAFYSTTEEINHLFTKQQEQLKAMQKTLEDEEHYQDTSLDLDVNQSPENTGRRAAVEIGNMGNRINGNWKPSLTCSAQREANSEGVETSRDSVTEKHDDDVRCEGEEQNTQEVEFPNSDRLVKGGFGSDIDGVGTAPMDVEGGGTEQFPETESPGNFDLNKSSTLFGETLPLEDDTLVQETEPIEMQFEGSPRHSHSKNANEVEEKAFEDTPGGTIRTADLLTSEVAGSWACSTTPSVHGENESPDNEEQNALAFQDSNTQVADSQNTVLAGACSASKTHSRGHDLQPLSEMIGILAPELKEQFSGVVASKGSEGVDRVEISDSDTEDCTSGNKDSGAGMRTDSASDAETQQADVPADNDKEVDSAMEEVDDDTQEDSVG